ncbi:MAG: UvrD-helicase domain-containing protein, partial [Actinomycetota bacterium]
MSLDDPRRSPAIRAALKGYEPTDEQWRAISHPLEPLYLIAGAGSGKTAVMAARIAWALEHNPFSPSQVLGLTFTNKASEELKERARLALAELHDETNEDVSVFTYNAFAAQVVRDNGLLVNVEPDAGLLTEAQQWQLVLSCIDDLPPFESLEVRSAYIVRWTLQLAGSVADHMCSVSDIEAAADHIMSLQKVDEKVAQTAAERKELVRAVAAYAAAKQRSQRIDFGDQITKAVEVLEGNDEARADYRRRFPFVLLDEYQDTNVAQRRMLQALIGPDGAVTAVGDARQAIFAWRGATMFNLINFPMDFPRADGAPYDPVSLSENFRSGSNILEVANHVVNEIDESRRPGDPLRAYPSNGTGQVGLGLFSDEAAECTWIAEQCDALHDTVTLEGRDPVQWKDMAILVRRKAAMDMLLQALEEKEIPVEVIGLGGLLKTPEVTEIVAWLRALETKPGANRWVGRILLGPRWRINYRDLSLLARWAASQNQQLRMDLAGGDEEVAHDLEPGDIGFALTEALNHLDEIDHLSDEARRRLKAFTKQLAAIRKKSNAPLLELVQEIIRRAGILGALDSSSSRTAGAARQNISNFLDQVASFAPVDGEATLRSLLAYLDAAEEAEETLEATQPADQDSVKLMTVHSAKGLEFECVFVPSVAASESKNGKVYSLFPNTRASNPLTSRTELPYEVREDREHLPKFKGKVGDFQEAVKLRALEDERRLFYVALTRAKQRLAVTASWWYGRDKREKGPSQFWEELEPLSESGLLEVVRKDDKPEENPMFEAMEDRREWPPVARVGIDDALFDDGWGVAADSVVDGSVTVESLLEQLSPDERAQAEALIAEHEQDLSLIAAAMTPPAPAEPEVPEIVSATRWIALQNGDITAWDLVRPLPERPTIARRIGTEVHRRIEERNRGISPFANEHDLDEPGAVSEPSKIGKLLDRWEELGYNERTIARLPSGEPMIELPFAMKKEGRIIRGRIDAVYETDDGGLEIVDWKTGSVPEHKDDDQISLYAAALAAAAQEKRPVRVTYAQI